MDNLTDEKLTAALEGLAREVNEATPRPGADLIARVLADAADAAPEPRPIATTKPFSVWGQLSEVLFGWGGGAVAALSICLALGIGVGLEMDASDMPGFGDPAQELALTVDGGMTADGIL